MKYFHSMHHLPPFIIHLYEHLQALEFNFPLVWTSSSPHISQSTLWTPSSPFHYPLSWTFSSGLNYWHYEHHHTQTFLIFHYQLLWPSLSPCFLIHPYEVFSSPDGYPLTLMNRFFWHEPCLIKLFCPGVTQNGLSCVWQDVKIRNLTSKLLTLEIAENVQRWGCVCVCVCVHECVCTCVCMFAYMSMCVCKSTCVLNLDFVLDAGLYFTYKCVDVCVHAYVCACCCWCGQAYTFNYISWCMSVLLFMFARLLVFKTLSVC